MQRSDIIQAAAQIFRQKGYHAASMQDIADAVGLQKASLYHHVDSKQDILLAILYQVLDLLIEDLEQVVESDLSPDEKLRRAMHVYVQRLTKESDLASVLLFDYRSLDPSLRSRQNARRDAYENLWRQIVRQGIDEGSFRIVDEAVTVFALLGLQNWTITWFRKNGRLSADTLADRFSDLILDGLRVSRRNSSR
jgi:AcrR family transcriptional regulator